MYIYFRRVMHFPLLNFLLHFGPILFFWPHSPIAFFCIAFSTWYGCVWIVMLFFTLHSRSVKTFPFLLRWKVFSRLSIERLQFLIRSLQTYFGHCINLEGARSRFDLLKKIRFFFLNRIYYMSFHRKYQKNLLSTRKQCLTHRHKAKNSRKKTR